MKIRDGFVSNSSSSSFVCIGARFKAKDSKLYDAEDDKFYELIDHEGAYYDSEGEGGYVYHGCYKLVDDEEWSFERVKSFDEWRKKGFDNLEERLTKEVHDLFEVPESKKVEFGMWVGRVAS